MRIAAGQMPAPPHITIVLVVSRIDEKRLRETIESLLAQTYPHWTLSVVGKVPRLRMVEHIINAYSETDSRIQPEEISEAERISDCILKGRLGEFVSFLSLDCYLAPEAMSSVITRFQECQDLDFLYADEDMVRENGEFVDPFFKPCWSPDLLIGMNYVGRFNVMRKQLLLEIGADWGDIANDGFYHLVLRVAEETNRIGRIPQVLCHCRMVDESSGIAADQPELDVTAQMKSLQDALNRRGESADVVCEGAGRFKAHYRVSRNPLVSIIIPTKDRWDMLRQCIESVESVTRYPSYEIVVVDNGSRTAEAKEYLNALSKKWIIHRFPGPFNFSEINNYGASKANGEFLLFLNDDTQVIAPDWMSAMVAQAQRAGVGAVGAKLLYPSGMIQHAGVVIGIRGVAGHAFRHLRGDTQHYRGLPDTLRNCSAVTAACMLMSAKIFSEIEGFDGHLKVEYNDVDLCLRLIRAGYRIIYTPDALLIHYENASRKGGRCQEDESFFLARWGASLRQGDPYYHPELTTSREDWSLKV
ncbi:MAG: glycosyltransferase family 2 protein [Nitrospirota bacterium]